MMIRPITRPVAKAPTEAIPGHTQSAPPAYSRKASRLTTAPPPSDDNRKLAKNGFTLRTEVSACGHLVFTCLEGSRRERGLMSTALMYAAVRTPFGRYGGGLADVRPDDLAA